MWDAKSEKNNFEQLCNKNVFKPRSIYFRPKSQTIFKILKLFNANPTLHSQ